MSVSYIIYVFSILHTSGYAPKASRGTWEGRVEFDNSIYYFRQRYILLLYYFMKKTLPWSFLSFLSFPLNRCLYYLKLFIGLCIAKFNNKSYRQGKGNDILTILMENFPKTPFLSPSYPPPPQIKKNTLNGFMIFCRKL